MRIAVRFWIALVPAMCVPLLASLFYFVIFSQHALVRPVFAAAKVFSVAWPLVCVYVIFRRRLPKIDVRSLHHWRAIPAGVAMGLLIVGAMYGFMQTPFGAVVRASAPSIAAKVRQLGIVEYYWAVAVFLSVIHSFVEEYYWRWFVYGHLRKALGFAPAVVLAGVSFAAHHIVVGTQFFPLPWAVFFGSTVGLGGAIWCVMYERQQTLVGVWVSHMLADFAIMAIGYQLIRA